MGIGGKKVQFLHSAPNHGIIPSQGGILSCGLAGEQFMPHGLSGALSVYTIRCELTPGEGGKGRAGKGPGTLGQTTCEGQLPTKTPPCSSSGWGAPGAPPFPLLQCWVAPWILLSCFLCSQHFPELGKHEGLGKEGERASPCPGVMSWS